LVREFGRDFRQRDHAVRVADGRGAKRELAVEDLDLLVEHLARRAGDGNLLRRETHAAHRDGEKSAAVLDRDLHMAAGRLDGEVGFRHELLVPEVAREDAQAVAGFLGLGAVGVEDAQRVLALLRRERAPEDAVGADAEVAVADDADLPDRGGGLPRGKIARIEDDVVVAEGVVFVESHGRNAKFAEKRRIAEARNW
jgi:hypothetical protein